MNKRINVILPTTTVSVLDRVAAKGNRSALIDRAIRHYVETQGRQNLRQRLKQEALANAERDLQMAAEWFPLEEEAWQGAQRQKRKKKLFPVAAKSAGLASTPRSATRFRRLGPPSSSRMTSPTSTARSPSWLPSVPSSRSRRFPGKS